MGSFVKVIMAETEDTCSGVFQTMGEDYPEPTLVIFDGQVRSACGFASAASGPFYCPGDQKVYIDLAFYDQLARKFGARAISRRPMCWRMRLDITCKTSPEFCRS